MAAFLTSGPVRCSACREVGKSELDMFPCIAGHGNLLCVSCIHKGERCPTCLSTLPKKGMVVAEEAEGSSLLSIPPEIFQCSLFPYLRMNEILRVRRLCKWTNFVANDYLRLYPRASRNPVRINLDSDETNEYQEAGVTLETFLQKDRVSAISMPYTNFHLDLDPSTDFQHQLIPEFLEKYGKQVKHLRVGHMFLPMYDEEFLFYSNLPNLTHLDIRAGESFSGKKKALVFPETFKNLKVLRIPYWVTGNRPLDFDNFEWKLFKFCQNLEHYSPSPVNGRGPVKSIKAFTKLRDYLEAGSHKNLRVLDLVNLNCWTFGIGFPFADIGEILCEIADRFNLSLINVSGSRWDDRHLKRLSSRISSIRPFGYKENSFSGIVLQNVKEIDELPWDWEPEAIEVITEMLTPTYCPTLKKLSIESISAEASTSLEHVWQAFPLLEYVSILFKQTVNEYNEEVAAGGDLVFIGTNPKAPAFLQLTRLKEFVLKLELQIVTDVVFFKVLRHMRLQKFFIEATKPVWSFTSSGIRALLKGPFIETIEDFPFHSWSLEDLNDVEFQELARLFPDNQNV